MAVTLQASFRDTLKPETVDYIDSNLDEYTLEDMLVFVDENSEDALVAHYDDYIQAGEDCGYATVDAFIGEFGIEDVAYCAEAFVGSYSSEADFAEEFYNEQYNIPVELVVDWQRTWDVNLHFDFTFVGDGYRDGLVFRSNY
jgi:hypothetical protein